MAVNLITNDKDSWVVKTEKYYENESKCVNIVHASYRRSEILYLCDALLECIYVNAKFQASPPMDDRGMVVTFGIYFV